MGYKKEPVAQAVPAAQANAHTDEDETEAILIGPCSDHGCQMTCVTAPGQKRKLLVYVETHQPQVKGQESTLTVVPDSHSLLVKWTGPEKTECTAVVSTPFEIACPRRPRAEPSRAGRGAKTEQARLLDSKHAECPFAALDANGVILVTCWEADPLGGRPAM